jgi:hypothetical protein
MPVRCIGVPWFTRTQYEKLLEVSDDRATMLPTFDEFERIAGQRFEQHRARGLPVEKMPIDVDDFIAWCLAEGCPIDAHARAEFAAVILMLRDKAGPLRH